MTAVEWLFDNLDLSGGSEAIETLKQAKEMEKEQKIDFARLCLNKAKDLDILTSFMNAEQYYKETFKSE
jgi:hypothetical protein